MAAFSVNDILGAAPKADKQPMEIVQLHFSAIDGDSDNSVYGVADLDLLASSILTQGLQQPLVVAKADTPSGEQSYKIISGHRRHAAIAQLRQSGHSVFDFVPCIVESCADDLQNEIRLVLANATCRDMTDWDKLQQYKELKSLLTKAKAAGGVTGKVRDAVQAALSISTGQAARYDVILKHASKWNLDDLKNETMGISAIFRNADYLRQRIEREKKENAERKVKAAEDAGKPKQFTEEQILTELMYGFQVEGAEKKARTVALLEAAGTKGLADHIASTYDNCGWKGKSDNIKGGSIGLVCRAKDVLLTCEGYEDVAIKFADVAKRIASELRWAKQPEPIDFSRAGHIKLKNEATRKQFLDECRAWPLLVSVPALEMTVYKYVLPDETAIAATVIKYVPRYGTGLSGTDLASEAVDYRLLQKSEAYNPCTNSQYEIIAKLQTLEEV